MRAPPLRCARGVLAGPELPGRLDDHADTQLIPVDRGRLPAGQHRDRRVIYGERARPVAHGVTEAAVGGIELQQVRQRPGVGHVVDRHDLQVVSFQGTPHECTTHPSEAVDSHPDRHRRLPSAIARGALAGQRAASFNSMTSITDVRRRAPTPFGPFHRAIGPGAGAGRGSGRRLWLGACPAGARRTVGRLWECSAWRPARRIGRRGA